MDDEETFYTIFWRALPPVTGVRHETACLHGAKRTALAEGHWGRNIYVMSLVFDPVMVTVSSAKYQTNTVECLKAAH
jgi:hypothetical protein